MIKKFYAADIKTILDAPAISVRKGTIARERNRRKTNALLRFGFSVCRHDRLAITEP